MDKKVSTFVSKRNVQSIHLKKCCCRKMKKISWTDGAKNEEVSHRVKEERHILQTIKGRLAGWVTSGVGTRY